MKTAKGRTSTAPTHQGPGFVRLISGKWKGRRLPVLDAQGLRPTSDRVKETLFNWLMQDVAGSTVLDCFAGSGSLGLEALSRYADFVLLLEKDAKAATLLKQHLNTLAAIKPKCCKQIPCCGCKSQHNVSLIPGFYLIRPFGKIWL